MEWVLSLSTGYRTNLEVEMMRSLVGIHHNPSWLWFRLLTGFGRIGNTQHHREIRCQRGSGLPWLHRATQCVHADWRELELHGHRSSMGPNDSSSDGRRRASTIPGHPALGRSERHLLGKNYAQCRHVRSAYRYIYDATLDPQGLWTVSYNCGPSQ